MKGEMKKERETRFELVSSAHTTYMKCLSK